MSSLLLVRDTANNKNVVLNVDGSNQLSVKDATAQSTLSSMNGKITACNTGAVVVSSSALPSGAASESTLSTINGKVTACDTGAVVVASSALPSGAATSANQSTANTALAAIETAVEGTLSVSFAPSRSSATLTNAASVSADDYTSAVDCNTKNKVAVYGVSSSNLQQIRLFVSDDDSNYYQNHDANIYASASNGNFYAEFDCVARYFKLQYSASATMTTKYSLRS
jgi:hypothetical protein